VAVKAEIINKLIKMDSPYVSRVFATGDFNGYPVEILPYYKYGSLQNKKFSYMELKKHIIPSLNEGLNVLHSAGIIHKDLKPSNIMLNDNQIDVAIIDFGISSVRDASNTVVVTSTGMTPEYSAPETFRSLFLNESDYYSLGITIYELFCGRTPYRGMTAEEIEKYVAIQNIPYPEEMPDDLKNLISALTYNDITNRKNKSNPNRRWGYDEVKKWCGGEKLTIPGEGIGNVKGSMPPYTFMGTAYTDKKALAKALGTNWNEGKKQLFRGILSGFFKAVDPEMAGICMDAEEAVDKGKDDDVEFF
jgi:serine/threonine protein kinase